jgi:hypothetical protein
MLADNERSEHANAAPRLAITFFSCLTSVLGVRDMTIGGTNPTDRGIDALFPAEIAEKAETVGVQKTKLDVLSLLALAVLAGAFIALGAMSATTVLAGADGILPFGLSRLLAGIAFCLGLILV